MKYEEVEPDPRDVPRALAQFVDAVKEKYGMRLHGIVLFGSRARGDTRPNSDADVAVILNDSNWSFWREKRELADLAYEGLIDWCLTISPWPISLEQWNNPDAHNNPRFVRSVRKDAKPLLETA